LTYFLISYIIIKISCIIDTLYCLDKKNKFDIITTRREIGGNIMELKGSKTEKNLMEAFAGESQARNKYTYFASKAKKKDMNKLLQYFKKQQIMKKNMQKYGLNY